MAVVELRKALAESVMPRHILQPPSRANPPQALVDELANELRNSKERGQPLVIEERLLTGLVQVQVVWDKFRRLSDEERIELILSAYEQVEGRDFREKIVAAIGYTGSEAADMGLLPFQVLPPQRRTPELQERCWYAMIEEGAFVDDEESLELRFRSKPEAIEAKDRLEALLPGTNWTVVEER
jgi:hypothetical protein